jgi:hypothetical protein
VSLGIIEPKPDLVRERGERLGDGELLHVDLLGRAVPVVRTPDGLLRAVNKGKPGNPARIDNPMASLLASFAAGIRADANAVAVAIVEPW